MRIIRDRKSLALLVVGGVIGALLLAGALSVTGVALAGGFNGRDHNSKFNVDSGAELAESTSDVLARRVTDGTLTEAQSDEITDWLTDAPDVVFDIDERVANLDDTARAELRNAIRNSRDERVEPFDFSALQSAGVLSVSEVSAIQEWRAAEPDVIDDLRPFRRGFGEYRENDLSRHHHGRGNRF